MPYQTTRTHVSPGAVARYRYVDTAEYETDWHAHDEYMFILSRNGDLSLCTEMSKAPLRIAHAQFALVPSGVYHSSKASLCPQAHLSVYVERDFVRYCEGQAGRAITGGAASVWDVTPRLKAALGARNTLAQGAAFAPTRHSIELADRLLAVQCIEHSIFAAASARTPEARRVRLIERIQSFLEQRLDEKIDLDTLAAEFGVSRRHLTRLFREQTGVSVVEFVNRLRVQRATALLGCPGATVLSVCLSVGLESPSYLAKLLARYGTRAPRA
jgi:AraC-like DNA-binding protein